jgi:hypothetical protein
VITVTRTYRATDACGNTNDCAQLLTVADTTPPALTCPANRFITTTNQAGSTVTFTASAADNCSLAPLLVCAPASGSFFAPGNTTVTCIATDACGNTNACAFVVTVNRTPVALNNVVVTSEGVPVSVALVKLLGNDSDADGDALTVVSVSPLSTNGGSVALGATRVTYTPLPGFIGLDRFSYTISDGRGGLATAEVEVTVLSGALPSSNQVLLQPVPGGFRVRFGGIPGRSCRIQRSVDLNTWTTVTTLTVPAHGIMEYIDLTGLPSAFYRALSP